MSVLASLNILLGMDVSQVKAGAKQTAGALKDMDTRARSVWSGQTEQLQAYERKLQSLADMAAHSKITPEEQASRTRMEGVKLGSEGGGEALAAYRDKLEGLSTQLSRAPSANRRLPSRPVRRAAK